MVYKSLAEEMGWRKDGSSEKKCKRESVLEVGKL
jgi:hypothetical protein